jgi:hypothetical protein
VNCHGQGNGAGSFLYLGPSYNTKDIRVDRCTAAGYDKAVWMKNGSLDLRRNNFSFNNWNLYLEGASGTCSEYRSITEASQHHAYYNVPIEISVGNFDPSHTQPGEAYIHFMQGLESLELRNSAFSNMPTARGAKLFRFSNDATHRQMTFRGNRYPWIDPAGATLALIGLDPETLSGHSDPTKRVGTVVLDGERGITDLPSGSMRFNAPILEAAPFSDPSNPYFMQGPPTMLAPGMSAPYAERVGNQWRAKRLYRLPDGSLGTIDLGPITRLKD